MAASLLDGVDLEHLRALAGRVPGPFGVVAACLVGGGALTHDPDDPAWDDRDRVVAGGREAASAIGAALVSTGRVGDHGVIEAAPWEALPLAAGLAAASRLEGGAFRIWCLLDAEALRNGAAWEAARLAVETRLGTLSALVVGEARTAAEAARMLAAAGWRVDRAARGDPAEVLAGLDHATVESPEPRALVASPR